MSSAALEITTSISSMQETLQRRLNRLNDARLRPRTEAALSFDEEMSLRELEINFLEAERARIAAQTSTAPDDAPQFLAWYEELRETGPGQNDALFPWLAQEATLEQVVWFLAQEVAGEAGFDDLVALTQIKMPVRPKLEMAANYWDEMGRGHQSGMHGPMLDRLAAALRVRDAGYPIVWESAALGNLLIGLAANRRYAYQSIGALGVVELTAPGRATCVDQALKRLGVAAKPRQYYALHATLDVRHSEAWNREVLEPLVTENPRLTRPIAEGALMRLNAGARCFERYRRELGLTESISSSSAKRT